MASIMVRAPRSVSSMKPCASSQASTFGAFRPASCELRHLHEGAQFSCAGGASMMMRVPPSAAPMRR
jgi:hypothetical protein